LEEAELAECQEIERETGQPLDRILKSKGYVSDAALLEFLSRALRIPLRDDLDQVEVPKEFVQRVPAQFARNYNLVGLTKTDGTFEVATCDPLDIHPMDEVAAMLSANVLPVIALRAKITALINKAYQRSSTDVDDLLDGIEEDDMISLTKV